MTRSLGFSLLRASKPKHTAYLGERSPRKHGNTHTHTPPHKGLCWGCSPGFCLLQPLLHLVREHAADPGLAARTMPIPSGAAAATTKLPSPEQ